jgi:hypothetical protein
MKTVLHLVSAIASLTIVTGCGHRQPDFVVVVDDVKGVKAKTDVVWRGTQVGSVSEVRFENNRFRINVNLQPAFQNQIRGDASVKITNGITTGFKPRLVVQGGQSANAPTVKPGSELPEFRGLFDFAQLQQWISSVAPDLRETLNTVLKSKSSFETEKLQRSIESDIAKIKEGFERGDETFSEMQRRIRRAIDAAVKELDRNNPAIESRDE